ncbi:Cryptochrome-1 [Bienertia sinuspersici]
MKWAVAASIAEVEALKNQGIARWNYLLRCVHQQHICNISQFNIRKQEIRGI